MAEAKPRPASIRPRLRPKTDGTPDADDRDLDPPETPAEPVATMPEEAPTRPPRYNPEEYGGFDEEVNNRYEEIKRGSTHISELQQMTMPQLLKVAKDEEIAEVTGLKKQDLIFRIL